jgi:hypothetical protein
MRQYWVAPLPPFHIADGTAYASSTTLTDVGPAPSIVIPANFLELGMRLEWYAFGRYSNTGTPTLTLGVYYGTGAIASGMAVCASSALTTVSGVTNRTWRLEGHGQVRAVGASTSGSILGIAEISNVTTNGTDLAPATAPAALACDTTVANKLMIGATWGTSSASNTLTCHYFGVRIVN